MSTKYRDSADVPTDVIVARLRRLVGAITGGRESMDGEFTMRVPAECDRDADLVLAEAARRLEQAEARVAELEDALVWALGKLSIEVPVTGGNVSYIRAFEKADKALSSNGRAYLLRKQAEAVDAAWHGHCRESAEEDCKVLYREDMEDCVRSLRQQAAEAEHAGDEK